MRDIGWFRSTKVGLDRSGVAPFTVFMVDDVKGWELDRQGTLRTNTVI